VSVLGVGIDIVELPRIARLHARHGEAFERRFCRPGERLERQGEALVQHLGGLFAAKEAVLKALGTGWAQGLGLLQVEVVRRPGGAPDVRLHAEALLRAEEKHFWHRARNRYIRQKLHGLGISSHGRILELGCGWGSLSLWMAVTISGRLITYYG